MALKDHVERGALTADRRHAVDRLLQSLPGPQAAEFADCLEDLDITSAALSKAIKAEYGEHVVAERIRDWRTQHGVTQG